MIRGWRCELRKWGVKKRTGTRKKIHSWQEIRWGAWRQTRNNKAVVAHWTDTLLSLWVSAWKQGSRPYLESRNSNVHSTDVLCTCERIHTDTVSDEKSWRAEPISALWCRHFYQHVSVPYDIYPIFLQTDRNTKKTNVQTSAQFFVFQTNLHTQLRPSPDFSAY